MIPSLSFDDAARRLVDGVQPVVDVERVDLDQGPGRILAVDLVSRIDLPPFDQAAMDGYAFGAAPTTTWRVVGRALAGQPFGGRVGPGEAVRIMTGAVVPEGADTVVMQEQAEITNAAGDDTPTVRFTARVQAGQNVRLRGEALRRGDRVLPAGQHLGPAEIGLAASMGLQQVDVLRRLRVAFFSTGTELAQPGTPAPEGTIFDSNRPTLHALLVGAGFEAIDLGSVPDDPQALERTMRDAASRADAILSTGGVSVGEADHTRAVLSRVGEVAFWSIDMRPGRPMAFGRIGKARYFGLPGNPVAAMITFLFLARPALQAMAGTRPRPLPSFDVPAAHVIRKKPGRTEFQRARLQPADGRSPAMEGRCGSGGPAGRWKVAITDHQGSGMLHSMSQADCIAMLAHDRSDVAAGEPVTVVPMRGLMGS